MLILLVNHPMLVFFRPKNAFFLKIITKKLVCYLHRIYICVIIIFDPTN